MLHPVSTTVAKAVYTALLGIPPQADSPYYVGSNEAAGQQIGLVPGGGPQGMTSPVAFWQVPDIEAKLAEATTAAGATVKEPAHDVGGGRLVATVTPTVTSSGSFRTREGRATPADTRRRRPA